MFCLTTSNFVVEKDDNNRTGDFHMGQRICSIDTLSELEERVMEWTLDALTGPTTFKTMISTLTQTAAAFGADDCDRGAFSGVEKQLPIGSKCMLETYDEVSAHCRQAMLTGILEGKPLGRSVKELVMLCAVWGRDEEYARRNRAAEAKAAAGLTSVS
jgi:hypothetical protein